MRICRRSLVLLLLGALCALLGATDFAQAEMIAPDAGDGEDDLLASSLPQPAPVAEGTAPAELYIPVVVHDTDPPENTVKFFFGGWLDATMSGWWNNFTAMNGLREPGLVIDTLGNTLPVTTAFWGTDPIDAVLPTGGQIPAAPTLSQTVLTVQDLPFESYDVRIVFDNDDFCVFEDIMTPDFQFSAQGSGVQPAVTAVEITGVPEVVPEPGTLTLALFGLLGLAVYGRRRSTAAPPSCH